MEAPVQWLQDQREMAQKAMERAQQEFDEAQQRLTEANKRLQACEEMLRLALSDKQTGPAVDAVGTPDDQSPRPSMTMPDQIKALLRERGPLTTTELRDLLIPMGRTKTTANSINTQLHKYKDRGFVKKDGKWHVV